MLHRIRSAPRVFIPLGFILLCIVGVLIAFYAIPPSPKVVEIVLPISSFIKP
jgi:hypothetical protein